eukprot:6483883-Amphidinium_carterae.2
MDLVVSDGCQLSFRGTAVIVTHDRHRRQGRSKQGSKFCLYQLPSGLVLKLNQQANKPTLFSLFVSPPLLLRCREASPEGGHRA